MYGETMSNDLHQHHAGCHHFQLAGSLAAPVVGAFLYRWLHGRSGVVRLFDGFMCVAVPAIILWQVLPHSWENHGVIALLVLLAGMGTPNLIERISRSLQPHTDNLALLAGLSGLVIHAFLEGSALVSRDMSFAYAVILHRIPVGLMIWWILRPRHGFRGAAMGIGTILVATVAGYAIGAQVFADGDGVALYQAFVGGTLLHAVFHQSLRDHSHDDDQETLKPS